MEIDALLVAQGAIGRGMTPPCLASHRHSHNRNAVVVAPARCRWRIHAVSQAALMSSVRVSNVIHLSDLSGSANDSAENRRASRRKVLKGAVAAFNDRYCSIACTVRDISATGARIRTDGSVSIPDTFELIIDLDGFEVDCEVVWRKDRDLGVRFLGAPHRVAPRRHQSIAVTTPERPSSLRRRTKATPPR